jgi:uncharacterized membrane protein
MEINQEIIKRIHDNFPSLKINIFPDKTQDNVIVAINDDLYYDEEYLALIMDIKMNLLWKNNIFNYLFVQEAPKPVFVSVALSSIHISVLPLSFNNNVATEAIRYTRIDYSDSSSDGDQLWPMAA